VLISNPIAKVCSIEKLEKDGLAKMLDKHFVVKLSHTHRRLSRRRIHRQAEEMRIGDALDPHHDGMGEGLPNTMTAHGIGDALDPLHAALSLLSSTRRFPFRLNGGFGEGFRLNLFGISAPYIFFLLHGTFPSDDEIAASKQAFD
jgi:hypothetical protein